MDNKTNDKPVIDLNRLASIRRLTELVRETNKTIDNLSRPCVTDLSALPRLHTTLQQLYSGTRGYYAVRAELFVLLYLFVPGSLSNRRIARDIKTVRRICNELGIKGNMYYHYRDKLLFLYENDRTFGREVRRGLEAALAAV